ncbi:DUF4178 domain-containing protein [Saccharopolyspora gloriosae]|uniref:DUF4178 domain-containing protein n=1 Tax=Saccharopolyspora gloriosae TaxID=455344 RepID=UPI001FB59AAF|nr:DUF4178 domain-containing protein [Saccharopolyspora gloriosae]
MTGLTIAIVLVGIVVAAGSCVWLYQRTRAAQQGTARPTDPFHTGDEDSLRGDPRALKAGDIVEIRGLSYTVRGTLRLSEGGWGWAEHLLDDAKGAQLWLAVEEDPDLELTAWTPVEDAGEPGAKRIEFGGRSYELEESGSATFRSEATTGLSEQGTVRYQDYEAEDGALLGFESYGESGWEAATGEELSRYDVRIYPAAI